MFKKTILATLVATTLASGASAINLDPFNTDFQTLMNGVARDEAPTLRLGALSADIQGDATIDRFSISVLGFGLTTADGVGRVLRPGAANWGFVLPLADLVNNNVGSSNSFERIVGYPSFKLGFGMALGSGWDVSLTGFAWPQVLADTAVNLGESDANGKLHKLKPKFSFANVGIQVRKTVIVDSGSGFAPAVSFGAGYHLTTFDLGVNLQSLQDLGIAAPSVGANQTLDMNGKFGVSSFANVITLDLQTSKHLLIFTPYAKLTGAMQFSSFTGNADLIATVTDTTVPSKPTTTTQHITASPNVGLADFSFLTTTGLEINLFIVVLNFNVVTDLGRAFLNVRSLDLNGIDANAFSLNAGLRVAF